MAQIGGYPNASTGTNGRVLGVDKDGLTKNFSPDLLAQAANVTPSGSSVPRALADAMAKAFPSAIDSKRVVIFGSSNGAGVGSSTYPGADPSAANNYASPATSWAGLLLVALQAIDPAWTVINRSISGTGTVQSIARFWTDVAPHRPSHVVICTHPLNDSLDPQVVLRNTALLCKWCDMIGAVPILRGAYNYNSYTAAQYQAMLALNRQLDLLGRHRIDHWSTLDNGAGGYVGGSAYHVDGLHPNDAGYAIQANAIDLGIFVHGSAMRFSEIDKGSAWQIQPSATTGSGLVVSAASGLLSFPRSMTMRARVKAPASAGSSKAFLNAYAQGDLTAGAGPIRYRNAPGFYDIGEGALTVGTSTVNPTSDTTTHDLTMVINAASNLIQGYIDGVQFCSAAPATVALTPCKTFNFGSRGESGNIFTAAGFTFADIGLWGVALTPAAIADMYRSNRRPPAGLLFGSNLAGSPGAGGLVPNVVANGILPAIGEAAWQGAPNL